jgi:hypothetical protein
MSFKSRTITKGGVGRRNNFWTSVRVPGEKRPGYLSARILGQGSLSKFGTGQTVDPHYGGAYSITNIMKKDPPGEVPAQLKGARGWDEKISGGKGGLHQIAIQRKRVSPNPHRLQSNASTIMSPKTNVVETYQSA